MRQDRRHGRLAEHQGSRLESGGLGKTSGGGTPSPAAIVEALLDEAQKLKCREGWIYVTAMPHGRYYVTATGQKAQTVTADEVRDYVRELARHLGGFALGTRF